MRKQQKLGEKARAAEKDYFDAREDYRKTLETLCDVAPDFFKKYQKIKGSSNEIEELKRLLEEHPPLYAELVSQLNLFYLAKRRHERAIARRDEYLLSLPEKFVLRRKLIQFLKSKKKN